MHELECLDYIDFERFLQGRVASVYKQYAASPQQKSSVQWYDWKFYITKSRTGITFRAKIEDRVFLSARDEKSDV